MTTTLAGPGPLFTQGGSGTTPGYSALDLRRSQLVGPIQEGVYAATDFQVTQRSAGGAALFVDIAAGGGAFAVVQGDALTGQGLYVVGPHSAAVITEAIATPDVTNPRIDQAVLEVFDNTLDASGLNIARVRIIAGSPTAGTTLNSRAGVAALPGSALLLADILVTAGATSVSNTQIRDRRKWARGAFYRNVVSTGGNRTTASTTLVAIDGTALAARIECSGVPLRVTIEGNFSAGTSGSLGLAVFVDGSPTDGIGTSLSGLVWGVPNNQSTPPPMVIVPAAGTHLIVPAWHSSAGVTSTLVVSTAIPVTFVIEEVIRQNANNATTTSG